MGDLQRPSRTRTANRRRRACWASGRITDLDTISDHLPRASLRQWAGIPIVIRASDGSAHPLRRWHALVARSLVVQHAAASAAATRRRYEHPRRAQTYHGGGTRRPETMDRNQRNFRRISPQDSVRHDLYISQSIRRFTHVVRALLLVIVVFPFVACLALTAIDHRRADL